MFLGKLQWRGLWSCAQKVREEDGCCQWLGCELHTGHLAFHFCTSPQTLTLNHQISNGASLSAHTSMLNGGWLMMADYWSYIWRFGFSIFNYSWELIFHCTIILMVTILSCTWPGRMADWRDAKLVWWRERARQRRDTETEDEWEARLRQWREITMDRGNLLIFLL